MSLKTPPERVLTMPPFQHSRVREISGNLRILLSPGKLEIKTPPINFKKKSYLPNLANHS
jgi:hypothetical protein